MFNCNPCTVHWYPFLLGGGILVDHWSTFSSFLNGYLVAILDFLVYGWHGFGNVTQVCFGISVSNFMCMSFVAVGRSLTIVSYVAFKMAALWFWTMFNCNPPIAHCHPLLWGGGILVDHWSTISSLLWLLLWWPSWTAHPPQWNISLPHLVLWPFGSKIQRRCSDKCCMLNPAAMWMTQLIPFGSILPAGQSNAVPCWILSGCSLFWTYFQFEESLLY